MSQLAIDRAPIPDGHLRIVVLLGGWSSEREVSLASGNAVIRALRLRGHDVRELDPAVIDVLTYPWAGVDAAFIALHGAFGEDGTIQSLLDDIAVPYANSGPIASRLAMHKAAAKLRFMAHGLPTPAYETARATESRSGILARADALGYPLVVKPNAQGSSVGVTIVPGPAALGDALDTAFRFDPLAILESFVAGREMTVAVLERRPLPAIEIRPARSFFDYAAKYEDGATQYVFDSELPPAVVRNIEAIAVSAAESLGCCGVARVDLRLDPENQPWLLEVNTIPGFTDHSLVPKAAARAGIPFPELCEQLIRAKVNATSEMQGIRAA